MNKAQMVDAMSRNGDISKVNAKKCIDAFIDVAIETLRAGDKITLTGFGSFIVSKKPPHIGRNFRTGSPIEIPSKSVVKFRPSFEYRE